MTAKDKTCLKTKVVYKKHYDFISTNDHFKYNCN